MAPTSTPTHLSVSEYLEKLPGTAFKRLYEQPSSVLAVHRLMLSPLAKMFVMRMLYRLGPPLRLATLDAWVKPEARRLRDQALSVLRGLHIVQITPPSAHEPQTIQLTSNYKSSMRMALQGTGTHNSFGVLSRLPVPPEVDVYFLDTYAEEKWSNILYFIVNSLGGSSGSQEGLPRVSVRNLLLGGGLIDRRANVAGFNITQRGFTFLLQESKAQVWALLRLWLEAGDAAGADCVDMLSFLFMLAAMRLGAAYDTDALTEQRRNLLPALVDFGLIYIPSHKPQQFFPTRLVTTLTSGSGPAIRTVRESMAAVTSATGAAASRVSSSDHHTAGIILETNFRIYAYTKSALQIAILHLFAKLTTRFPGMVVGKVTRKSIRRAIARHGITADQIVGYLTAHAHEQLHRTSLAKATPLLPPTVVDQIVLWQLELERMKTAEGFLFRDFEDAKEYTDVANFADQINVLVWRNDAKNMFFANNHVQIRDYLKLRKKGDGE